MYPLYKPGIMQNQTLVKIILIQTSLGNNKTAIQQQFPVQLACAWTIHRAQGLTKDTLAFDPKGIRKNEHIPVLEHSVSLSYKQIGKKFAKRCNWDICRLGFKHIQVGNLTIDFIW